VKVDRKLHTCRAYMFQALFKVFYIYEVNKLMR
jgi:hypothetical protein